MSGKWPAVPLGEILCRAEDWVTIQPTETYREVTVRLWGKGVTLRRKALGAEIKASRRLRVRPGQLIASRIDARNGAFGLVPPELDGAVVSNDFPVFEPNGQKLHMPYLGWFSTTSTFVELCKAASEGTTNRVRLKEDRFLATAIPLPPIEEQRRIVDRIETVVGRVREARKLRDETEEACQAICRSMLFQKAATSVATPMRELVRRRPATIVVQPTATYHFAGVYCFGRGMFRGQRRQGTEFAYRQLTTLQAGDFVYPKLMAWEGALAVVPPDCSGLVVSPEFPVFEVNQAKVLPEVLDVYFRTPAVWPALSGASTGTNVRRRRLNPADFLRYEMPLPPMGTQRAIQAVKAKIDSMREARQASAAFIDALLPSYLDRAFNGEL